MGPFAGIGDTIDWSTLKPLFIMLVLPLAESGSFLAPIIYLILLTGVTYAESFIFINTGYKMGTEAALTILEGGAVNKFISCASVLGMFMMGGLSASMVSVYTTAQIPTGGQPMGIQSDILDAVAPGLLTLAAVLLVYKYLRLSLIHICYEMRRGHQADVPGLYRRRRHRGLGSGSRDLRRHLRYDHQWYGCFAVRDHCRTVEPVGCSIAYLSLIHI